MKDRAQILELVPQAGRMCLLDRAVRWTELEIECSAGSHRDAANPLRRDGRLSAIALVEYGAQAAALHSALNAPEEKAGQRPGMIVAVRDCDWQADYLDDLPHDITLRAYREAATAEALNYRFEAAHAGRELGRGRLTIRLD
jgi:predicted hotdog family 3-hydroxylacyl-ACP dehydratase